jgi:hypothetical protein
MKQMDILLISTWLWSRLPAWQEGTTLHTAHQSGCLLGNKGLLYILLIKKVACLLEMYYFNFLSCKLPPWKSSSCQVLKKQFPVKQVACLAKRWLSTRLPTWQLGTIRDFPIWGKLTCLPIGKLLCTFLLECWFACNMHACRQVKLYYIPLSTSVAGR